MHGTSLATLPALALAGLVTLSSLAGAAELTADSIRDFAPIVGIWKQEAEGSRPVLKVDGSAWKRGQAAPEIEKSSRAVFGGKAEGFMKRVVSAANFPFAVYTGVQSFQQGKISVRLKPIAGKSDQAGGILFDLKENGDYLVLRANALESNLILFQFKDGRRSALKEVGGAPATTGQWHELMVIVQGSQVAGILDGHRILEHDIGRQVLGPVGLWSKDDSVTFFSDFQASVGQ